MQVILSMTDTKELLFGDVLRESREDHQWSLRQFAAWCGVSPTYLSQVEQNNVPPPTAERVRRMAELCGEDVVEWCVLAGRIPNELLEIFFEFPHECAAAMRALAERNGWTPNP